MVILWYLKNKLGILVKKIFIFVNDFKLKGRHSKNFKKFFKKNFKKIIYKFS